MQERIQKFKDELVTLAYRYHIHHPFDKLLQSGNASKEMLQLWAANRYYYQDIIPRKDAAVIANCPHSELRAKWCTHIQTHDTDGALGEWLMLTDALGLDRNDVIDGKYLLAPTKFSCDAYLNFCKESCWQDGMCASMTHLFAGDIHRLRIANWPDRYPWLPETAFTYFKKRTTTLPDEIDVTLQLLSEYYLESPERMQRAKDILKFKQDILWAMMDALWMQTFVPQCRIPTSPVTENTNTCQLMLLGTGAGGGVPQWNAQNDWNAKARLGIHAQRTQCSGAMTNNGQQWFLINASPDFRQQWNSLLAIHPNADLVGIVLTDAELDHITGLLSLRESKRSLNIYTSKSIQDMVEFSGIFKLLATYTDVVWKNLDSLAQDSQMPVEVITLGQKVPKYAKASNMQPSDILGLKFTGHTPLMYAPVVPDTHALEIMAKTVKSNTTLLLDGTFFSADEMPNVKGHLSVQDTLEKCKELELSQQPIFIRRNHTNHMSDEIACGDGDVFMVG